MARLIKGWREDKPDQPVALDPSRVIIRGYYNDPDHTQSSYVWIPYPQEISMTQQWDTVNSNLALTFSDANLTCTQTSIGYQGAVSTELFNSGLYYWQNTNTSFTRDDTAVTGLANLLNANNDYLGSSVNGLGLFTSDGFYINGLKVLDTSASLTNPALIAASGLICNAVNFDLALFWARFGLTGDWNGNPAADPAAGVGGVDISPLLAGGAVGPAWSSAVTVATDSVTAAYAASTWSGGSGIAPSGFGPFDPTPPSATMLGCFKLKVYS